MLKVHVIQQSHTGPDFAGSVMRRITEREQAKARSNGTFSASFGRNARTIGTRFIREPDSQADRILTRCRMNAP